MYNEVWMIWKSWLLIIFFWGGEGVFLWQLKEVTICMNEHGHFYS